MPVLQLIAPSGNPHDRNAVARGVDYFTRQGWRVTGQACALRQMQRFAGTDEERLHEINSLTRFINPTEELKSKRPDLVMALRGGYGLSRLLDRIDYAEIAKAKLCFMGHSDFTAFNLAYLAQAGMPSYNGPMMSYDFGADTPSKFMLSHFWNLLNHGEDTISVKIAQPYTFNVNKTLWGGNLTMINQLIGTPYLPNIEGGILFLEDINEHPYRIERNLYQLRDAGILEQQSAILLGQFNGFQLYDSDAGYDFGAMVEHFRSRCDVPILMGLPYGHVREKATLPVGQKAQLRVQGEAGFELVVRAIACV